MNTVIVENCKTLFIGRRGENEVTEVVFDFSEWQEQFGAGVIDLYVKRNLDVDAYPVVLSVDGTVATWLVTAADTDVVGNGKIEFVYTVDQKVAKSAVFPFFVGEDIGESSPEPPEHYQSWLEQLTELGAETQANAQAAAQSASEAAESVASAAEEVDKARLNAEDAEAWAVGERGGEPVSEGDETYENNAKYWAENAKTAAPVQSVNGEIGDVELTLDDIPNGESFVRTTPEQLAQITTNTGGIADINAKIPTDASASNQLADKNYISNYYLTKAAQSATDAAQNARINNINAVIPNTASAQNQLADKGYIDSKLFDYRTASQQNLIDNNKQVKITANGILKGNGNGGVSAAVAGMDYLPTSALYAYRSANAQDAIDNAQNDNINKNTAALNTMQPAATAADIGKALIVKTVADGKPTSYEYGEAGGGGSTLTAGDGIDITEDVISNTQGIEYIVGTQTAATSKWTGVSTDETLKVGKIIAYYLPFAGTSTVATLALTMADGTTTREISLQYKPNSSVTTQFPAGSIIILVYDGTYWRVNASYDTDTNTYPTGYCVTNGSVAAKAAACSFGYRGDTNYFPCLFRYANTAADATLAITTYAPEAAPIYVNGQRTSATNTFSAGVILFLYYNGAYYCYNDGRFPILVDGAVTSVQEYATGLLVNYRTSAAQDTIDAGKQAKITATGILKGDGAGGVSAAVAGEDYITGLEILSYGNSTWADFLAAYTANKVVYCRASSNSNPASGSQTRMAFMAYVNDAANPTNVEFQYYRSVQTHSDSQQGDQVFVYKLDKTGGWTVTTRNTFTAIDAGTGLSKAYANGKLTLSVDGYRTAADQDVIDNEQDDRLDAVEQTTTATTIGPVAFATFNASAAGMPLKGLTVNIEPVQSGSGDPSPDNVRPITGWTGCRVFYPGLDITKDLAIVKNKYISISGVETDSTTTDNSHTDYFPVTPGTALYFSSYWDELPGSAPSIAFYDASKTFKTRQYLLPNENRNKGHIGYNFIARTVPSGSYFAILNFNYGLRDRMVLMDEDPVIAFPSPDPGTVYGGTLDVVNRKLNSYPYYSSYNGETIIGPWISSMDVYTPGATPTLGAQVVDMGGAVTSYDLSDVPEITTLFGENTIWADCGSVTVTYGAYLETVKAHADKVGDSILSAIAPLETSYTASRAYTVGSFLFVGTQFYKVTAAIASGDTITPDTNVTQTTVAEQLMTLAGN